MEEFDTSKLMNLDECVIDALNLLSKTKLPSLDILKKYKRPLVVGSGNAAVTGRIIFEDVDAVFANEGTYEKKIDNVEGIDGAILISASGGKHAPKIAKDLKERGLEVWLFTCNPEALAKEHVDEDKTLVYPKNPEPYTYNDSTYKGMILSRTNEDPKQILNYIKTEVDPLIPPNLADYDAFYLIVSPEFDNIREMLLTKFDELFGSKISGRVYTPEQTKHAKTVVPSDKEMFISFGYNNQLFGNENARLNIPLPENAGYAAMMAIAYYVIGKIQAQNEPFFKKNIVAYCEKASNIFGQKIEPIVK